MNAIKVLAVALLMLGPTPIKAFWGKSKGIGNALDDSALPGEPSVVTEAVTDELIAIEPAAAVGEGAATPATTTPDGERESADDLQKIASKKKSQGASTASSILEKLHVPHAFATSGATLPSTEVKHQGVMNPLKYVDAEVGRCTS